MDLRRHIVTLAVILALLCGGAPAPASAQLTPADSASVLLATAVRFDRDGRGDVAEALYRFIAQHFAATAAGAEARTRLDSVSAASLSQGSGRVELQVWSTLYGVWLGVAIPAAVDAEGSAAYGLGILLGGPGGFLAGKALARSRPITVGQARAITMGGSWGTWQGLGWTNVLDIGEKQSCDFGVCVSDDEAQARFAGMVVGGLTGVGVGALLSRRDISPGTATAVNFGALWGTWFGFAGGYLLDLEDDNLLAATLVGGDAGLLGTALMASKWRVSRSRARLVSIYGVMGGLAGLGVDLLVEPDDDKVAVAVPFVGSALGLIFGSAATRDYDSTHSPDGEGGEMSTAFLRHTAGKWDVGMPLPVPRRLALEGAARGKTPAAALGVSLLEVRFR